MLSCVEEGIEKKIVKFAEDRDWLQFNTPENLAKSISIEEAKNLADNAITSGKAYEKFKEFHKIYYHPSNCKLFLYGNISTKKH